MSFPRIVKPPKTASGRRGVTPDRADSHVAFDVRKNQDCLE